MIKRSIAIVATLVVLTCLNLSASRALAGEVWGTFPENANPKEVGKKVVNNLLARTPSTRPQSYPEVCTAYGSFRFVDTIKDKELLDKLLGRYSPMLEPDSKIVRKNPANVDASIWGALPLKIYQITGEKRYLELGLHCADYQWEKPDFSRVKEENRAAAEAKAQELMSKGLTAQTRFWIDDMFMITGLQVNA